MSDVLKQIRELMRQLQDLARHYEEQIKRIDHLLGTQHICVDSHCSRYLHESPSWPYGKSMPSVVDQREVQKLGGLCAHYPTSCFMRLLAEILDILDATVLDLTFGVGEFYRFWRPRYLVAFDVVDWRKRGFRWVVEPDEFYEKPFWAAESLLGERAFDVVVFDPPYDTRPSSTSHAVEKPWLYHGSDGLRLMLRAFPRVALRYARRYVIAKFMDGEDITVEDLVAAFGRKPTYRIVYRFLHRHRPRANTRILKTHVYFLIWKL